MARLMRRVEGVEIDRGASPFPLVALVVEEGVLGVPPVEKEALMTHTHSMVDDRLAYWHIYSLSKLQHYRWAKYRYM